VSKNWGEKHPSCRFSTRLEGASPISHGYRYNSDAALQRKLVAIEYTLEGREAKTEIPGNKDWRGRVKLVKISRARGSASPSWNKRFFMATQGENPQQLTRSYVIL